MLKELIFRLKVKKLDEIHIRQYLERQGFEFIYLDTERGKQMLEKLEIEEINGDSFVYDNGRFKYVFLSPAKNDDDKLMTLLHECGHIELSHKSRSKYNEAKAWSFAYNLTVVHFNILKLISLLFLTAVITFYITNMKSNTDVQSDYQNELPSSNTMSTIHQAPQIQQNIPSSNSIPEQQITPADESTQASMVYVTKSGTKFHRADCHYVDGKNVTEYTRSDAEKSYSPCKVCRP